MGGPLWRNKKSEHESDKSLLAVIAALAASGLVFLSSASAAVAYAKIGSTYFFFFRQLIALAIGLVVFYAFYRIDYHFWRKYAFFFLLASCALLLLVFIPGVAADYGHARSWVRVFGFGFQPSEFVKIFFLIYLAAFLESRKDNLSNVRQGIGPLVLIIGFIAVLMMKQPDFGTLFIILASALVVYFAGGGKTFYVGLIVLTALAGIYFISTAETYQSSRIKCFLDPSYDFDKCYQLNQSLIAVGSGGLFGRGLGQSRQKFFYLPEVYGDSIFAVIAEEIGFVACAILVALYIFLFYRLAMIAKRAPDLFGRLLAMGISAWLAIQTFLNIGGIIGLVPMTGVPLPLVSQGGSNLIATLLALGIVLNISRQTAQMSRR